MKFYRKLTEYKKNIQNINKTNKILIVIEQLIHSHDSFFLHWNVALIIKMS